MRLSLDESRLLRWCAGAYEVPLPQGCHLYNPLALALPHQPNDLTVGCQGLPPDGQTTSWSTRELPAPLLHMLHRACMGAIHCVECPDSLAARLIAAGVARPSDHPSLAALNAYREHSHVYMYVAYPATLLWMAGMYNLPLPRGRSPLYTRQLTQDIVTVIRSGSPYNRVEWDMDSMDVSHMLLLTSIARRAPAKTPVPVLRISVKVQMAVQLVDAGCAAFVTTVDSRCNSTGQPLPYEHLNHDV